MMVIKNIDLIFDVNKIPISVKIGVLGELIGRIGMGMMGLFFIFYLLELFGSLIYLPLFLTIFIMMSIVGGTLTGFLTNKLGKDILVTIILLSGLFLLFFSSIFLESFYGILLLESIIGLLLGIINPTFTAHISKVTNEKSQDKSFSFYRGANILGQNSAGFLAGLILIVLFNNDSSINSLRSLMIIAYALIGIQAILFTLIKTKNQDKLTQNNKRSSENNRNKLHTNTHKKINPKTKWILILSLILTSFGIGTSYSYIPLFISSNYLVSLSFIGIFLSIVGVIAGSTIIFGNKLLGKFKKQSLLAFSEVFFGLSGLLLIFFPPLALLFLLLLSRDIISALASPIVKILLMNSVHEEKREIWSSIEWMVTVTIELIGSIIAVFILESYSILFLFMISGIAFIIGGIIVYSGIK
ncbi:MAG: hypothetical protein HeimC3_09940 [Candidatus Heimdallarchaeota archaeon LC_3]|nr:MAG: hypothetical protein HeimC3_09940 [Candidatus Heimdallarchaeota archaeon LC_3]